MTDRVIRIVVDSREAEQRLDRLEGELAKLDRSTKGTRRSTNELGRAFRTVVAGLSIREISRLADTYTVVGSRIRLVTDSTRELNTVQDQVVAIAQRTRSDLTATADLYSRVARSVEALNTTQAENLRFTEAVNQSIQISGATAAEAAASTVQFAQGLAAGALRGDELRSVLEQNSRLAQVLAEAFETDIGGLRKLGEEGELTADRIFDAVLRAGPALRAEFETITPTIDQTQTTIKTFATVVVGGFNEAAGVTEGLVDIFQLTDDQTANLAATVRDLGLSFREFVEVATVSVAAFAETVAPAFAKLRADIVGTIGTIIGDDALIEEAIADRNEFVKAIDQVAARLDAELVVIRQINDERRKASGDRDADLNTRGAGGAGGADAAAELTSEQAQLIEQQQRLVRSLELQAEAQRVANETGEDAASILRDLQILELAAANGNEAFADSALQAAAALDQEKRQAELLAEAQRQDNQQKERAAEITASVATEAEIYADRLRELQELLAAGLITPQTFERARNDLRSFDAEIGDFFRRARENSQDILSGFLERGLTDLDDFGREVLQLFLRLQSEALAANILGSLFGAAGGPLGGIIGGLFGSRQFGGGVQAGQAVNINEGGRRNTEAFVPNRGGTVVPLSSAAGAQMAQSAPPEVNVINALDSTALVVEALNGGGATSSFLNIIGQNREAFRTALGVAA